MPNLRPAGTDTPRLFRTPDGLPVQLSWPAAAKPAGRSPVLPAGGRGAPLAAMEDMVQSTPDPNGAHDVFQDLFDDLFAGLVAETPRRES